MARIRKSGRWEWPQGTGPVPQLSLTELPRRPYTYRGTDHTTDEDAPPRRRRKPAKRPGSPFIDPGGQDLPHEWPHEFECELREGP